MTITIDAINVEALQALPWGHITDYILAVLGSGLGASILTQAYKHYSRWTGPRADAVKGKIYLLTNAFSWLVGLYPALTTISLLPADDHLLPKLFVAGGTFGLVYKASHLAYRVSVSPLYKKYFNQVQPTVMPPLPANPFTSGVESVPAPVNQPPTQLVQ